MVPQDGSRSNNSDVTRYRCAAFFECTVNFGPTKCLLRHESGYRASNRFGARIFTRYRRYDERENWADCRNDLALTTIRC